MDTNQKFKKFTEKLTLNPPAIIDQIKEVEKHFQIEFPSDYVDFMLQSDGAEGSINEAYVQLWKIEDLPRRNAGYEFKKDFADLILFGSDGGGEAYAFEKQNNMFIVNPPYIGSPEDTRKCAKTFSEFLQYLYDQD